MIYVIASTGMEWAVYLLRSGWWFTYVDVADFNGDGFTDILAGATDGVELLVYDLSGKLVRKLSERNGSIFFWDGCDSSGDEAPSGSYIVRGVVEDRSASVRFVKL